MAEQPGIPPSVNMRDEVYGSLAAPQVDRLGRKQPHILGAIGILKAGVGAGLPAPIEIPGDFWTQDVNAEGFSEAQVSCPCGETPCVEVGCVKRCACERYFYFAVDRVMAFNSPKVKPIEAPPVDPADVAAEPPAIA